MADIKGIPSRAAPGIEADSIRLASEQVESDFKKWMSRAYGRREFSMIEQTLLRGAFANGRKVGFTAGIRAGVRTSSATGTD